MFVSTSAELSTAVGEYERFSTTVINAYVSPPLARTVRRLRSRLEERGFAGDLLIAQSDGGCLPPAEVRPAYTMMSGPAGGVIASQREGRLIGHANVIATDVGGTSFDVGMVVDGLWLRAENPVVDQMHLSVPMIEVESIGAGGASIAWVDDGGALNVGPQSAGANPGPAAYGRGGTEPTLTDADIVLGYVNPDYFLGGKMSLDTEAARRAVGTVAARLGMEIEQAAAGIAAIANAKMAALLSQRVLARGYDPRDFVVFAYGGAGAMHAAMYAAELQVSKVVVPALAGAFSAMEVSTAPLLHQAASNDFAPMPMDPVQFRRNQERLEQKVTDRLVANGVAPEDREVVYSVGMRYGMQLHTVRLELPSLDVTPEAVCEAFDRRYEQLYGEGSGYSDAGRFLTSFQVEGYGHPRTSVRARAELGEENPDDALTGRRPVFFEGVAHEASIYRHESMTAGTSLHSPCVVEAPHTTMVIPPGHRASVDEYLNVHIELPTARDLTPVAAAAVSDGSDMTSTATTTSGLDPVTFGVLRHKLDQIIAEAYHTIGRVSGSTVVYEAGDHQEAILTGTGDLVVFGAGSLHWCQSISAGVKHVVARYTDDPGINDGDQFLMNDTYVAAVHANDIQVLAPVMWEDEIIVWAGSASHHNDLGGMDIGSMCVSASDVYQEGFACSGLKIVDRGVVRRDVQDLFFNMTRIPELNILEIRAKVASNNVIRMRILEMVQRYGVDTVKQMFVDLMDYSERRIRSRLLSLRDGEWSAATYAEGIRNPWIKVQTTVIKRADTLTFDFTGSSPPSPGSDNCGPIATKGAAVVPYLVTLCHDIPWNEGVFRVLDYVLPENSLVNATKPAAVSANVPAGSNILCLTAAHSAISRMLLSAEDPFWRREACGNVGASFNVQVTSGLNRQGQFFAHLILDIMAGGMGGMVDRDGPNTAQNHWTAKASVANIESTELLYPLLFLWRREVPDSGGAGAHRGGMGVEDAYIPWGVDEIGTVHLGVGHGPRNCLGVAGGYPASNVIAGYRRNADVVGRFFSRGQIPSSVEEIGGEVELGPVTGISRLGNQDVFFGVMASGGGGLGDPLERTVAEIEDDLRLGVVTAEMATGVYGIVLGDDGAADAEATTRRRNELRQARLQRSQA